MLYRYNKANPQIHVFSDASGSWGWGAYSGNTWFQFQWPADMRDCHISIKEMISVVMAAIVWGHHRQGLSVCFHTDNTAVVALINQGSVRDSGLMHLMRCLSFISAKFNFIFSPCHIRGLDNVLADALSRNNLPMFLMYSPNSHTLPTLLPLALISQRMDWTSPSWTRLWTSIFSGP